MDDDTSLDGDSVVSAGALSGLMRGPPTISRGAGPRHPSGATARGLSGARHGRGRALSGALGLGELPLQRLAVPSLDAVDMLQGGSSATTPIAGTPPILPLRGRGRGARRITPNSQRRGGGMAHPSPLAVPNLGHP